MYSLVLMMAFSAGVDPAVDGPVVSNSGRQGVVYSGNCTGTKHAGFLHRFQGDSGGCYGSHPSFFAKHFHKAEGKYFGCNGGTIVTAPAIAPASPEPPKPLPTGEPIPAPKEKKQASGADSARILVQLPPEARLFVDDEPTRSTSARRTLVTPTLLPGLTYSYSLRIEVNRNGKTQTEVKRVNLTAGQTAEVFFPDTVETGRPTY